MRREECGLRRTTHAFLSSVSLVFVQHPEDSLLKHHDEAQLIDMRAAMAAAGAILEVSQRAMKDNFLFIQNSELTWDS